jgi:penicillin-binding protein 1A
MGKYETGGHTALPIWMDFMSAALKGRPVRAFPAPEKIKWVPIEPKTGRYKPGGTFLEAFREGTEPTAEDPSRASPVPALDTLRGQDL